MSVKLFYLDLETSGVDSTKHGIWQMAGRVIIGQQEEQFNMLIRPFEHDILDPEALAVGKQTEESLFGSDRLDPIVAYRKLMAILGKYVDKFDRRDKFHLVAFNATFEDQFMRRWFEKCDDKYYGSWFFWPTVDVAQLAGYRLMKERHRLENFRNSTVAAYLGIEVDQERLHEAQYDIDLTQQIMRKLHAEGLNAIQ